MSMKTDLIFYCGNWNKIPRALQDTIAIVAIDVQTGPEIAEIGKALLGPRPYGNDGVFTNVQLVFDGLRLAIKELDSPEDPPVKVVFYADDGEVHHITLDGDGNMDLCPNGFFDTGTEILLQMF